MANTGVPMGPHMTALHKRHGHFGWISPGNRNAAQYAAHRHALVRRAAFNLAPPTVAAGTKVILSQALDNADVMADQGVTTPFNGFHQLTGSCVGVSAGNAITILSAVQRLLADTPTKAFIAFWGYAYGRTRFNEGDRGQGEGAIDSVMGETLRTEGNFDRREANLPTFNTSDGWMLTKQQEYAWSDGGSSLVQGFLPLGKAHLLGSSATLNSVADIKAAILNGYVVLDGCDDYVGNGSLQGSGSDACVVGNYDGRGGHSTCYIGYWEHPSLGPLYLYSNQWPSSTYPQDGSGKWRCSVWVKESNVNHLFQGGGGGGETMALSHQNYFPAQPKVMDWADYL